MIDSAEDRMSRAILKAIATGALVLVLLGNYILDSLFRC